jgi:elongation factor P
MQYLYNDGNLYTFMDNQTYEQISIAKGDIGESIAYMKEGLEVKVAIHNGNALTIELPQKVQYTVAYTEPAVKGDTASGNVLKDAQMDNGLAVRVPMFINQGDEILVNTGTGEYSERMSA